MKANKKTLLAFRRMMEDETEAYDYEGLVQECVDETGLLKTPEMGEHLLSTDECGIEWGGTNVCVLSDFIDSFASKFLDKILNMAESMIGEDIDFYFEDEE
jgi:hypothetical protein